MLGDFEQKEYVSLYFHIPFCSKKCPYCHFYVTRHTKPLEDSLTKALCSEIKQSAHKLHNRRVPSLYFGGGTPSKLSISSLEKILQSLKDSSIDITQNAEITLEANPEDLNFDYLKDLRALGFNRLSIGVQSLEKSSLALIKREHKVDQTIEGIHTAYKAGFSNITIDLMYDLPNQTLQQWRRTLANVKLLPISHVSLYNLTVEPNSAYFRQKEAIMKKQPKEETSLLMLQEAVSALESLGLHRYEISAFAKKECHSVHNTGYWLGRDFLGFGPSAFSFFEKKRFKNLNNLPKYIDLIEKNESPVDFEETLLKDDSLKEAFCVQLRMLDGINLEKFPKLPEDLQKALEKKIKDNLLIQEGSIIRLSEKGILFYDDLAADLI